MGNDHAIHAHRFLFRAGLSLANVFAWIFIFEYFYFLSGNMTHAFASGAILYALAQIVIIAATPISAAHLKRGTKHSLIWGVVFASGAFTFLGGTLAGYFNDPPAWGIVAFAILYGAYRALYWVPYQLTFADIKTHLHMRAYLEVLVALMPLFAGLTLISVQFGRLHILFGAAALIMLSIFPALFLNDTREHFSWSTSYTFSQLWRRKNHGIVLQSLLEGFQGAVLFLIWPLAIFLILEWSYLGLGLVFSLTLLFMLLFRRVYVWLINAFNLRDSSTVHVIIAMSGWVARFAAGTSIGIIIADVYAHTTMSRHGAHTDPFSFEQAGDRGAFLDEYTVLKEMGLATGRMMLCVVIFFLALAFTLPIVLGIALGIAGIASGLSVMVARRATNSTY
ncbi:MAG: hypothetical protein AAB798_02040 [Patescibacteria group bacterium]